MTNLIDTITLSETLCEYPIQVKLAYATADNLVGRILQGYAADAAHLCLLTPKAANALCHVQNYLISQERLGLFVYDAYRPKRAVRDFFQWAHDPSSTPQDFTQKAKYYPNIAKAQLFDLGYIAEDSNHCYGNTVDLVLMDLQSQQTLAMGAIFDFMDVLSHWTATAGQIGQEAYQNRQKLLFAMEKFGFEPYEQEFWHFSHGGRQGREIHQPLDIEITVDLKGCIA